VEVTSVAVGCVVASLVDPVLEPEVACLVRLFFGWAISEPPGAVGSGDRALLPDAFLAEVEEDLAPLAGFAVFWQCFVVVSTGTRHHVKDTYLSAWHWVVWNIVDKNEKTKKNGDALFVGTRLLC